VIIFSKKEKLQPGDYVMVKVTGCTQATLLGEIEEGLPNENIIIMEMTAG
jgi:hypothetical protein